MIGRTFLLTDMVLKAAGKIFLKRSFRRSANPKSKWTRHILYTEQEISPEMLLTLGLYHRYSRFPSSGELRRETIWLKSGLESYGLPTRRATSTSTRRHLQWLSEIMPKIPSHSYFSQVCVPASQPCWHQSILQCSCGNSRGQLAEFPSASCFVNQMVGCIKASSADVRGERTQLDFQVQEGERESGRLFGRKLPLDS